MLFDKIYKDGIITRLKEKNVNKPCNRCDNLSFECVGITAIEIYKDSWLLGLNKKDIGIPSAIVVCTNCGYITMHALGILNLN